MRVVYCVAACALVAGGGAYLPLYLSEAYEAHLWDRPATRGGGTEGAVYYFFYI